MGVLNAEGSLALDGNGERFQPAQPVDEVIDTTGYGDAYQAAFSLSWFADGNLERAMEKGTAAAAKVLSRFGGV